MNVGQSKVMVLEGKEVEMCDFSVLNWVSVPARRGCQIVLFGESME